MFFIQNVKDTIKLNGFTIKHGSAHSETNHYGGGIYCYNSKLLLTNINLDENIASRPNIRGIGGGIYIQNSYVSLDTVQIRYCSALYTGGGVYCIASSLYCNHSRIENNGCLRKGCVPLHFSHSNLTIKNSMIANNSHPSGEYQDINIWHCTGIFENVIVYNDSITFYESSIELINCNIPGY